MATYCIICGNSRTGIPVHDDFVLQGMRWFKRNVTKNEKGYGLVVCKQDYDAYSKNRKRYLSRQAIYVGIGLIFFLLTIAIAFSTGKFGGMVFGVACLMGMFLISLLNYTPALKTEGQNASRKKQNQ